MDVTNIKFKLSSFSFEQTAENTTNTESEFRFAKYDSHSELFS